MALLSQWAREKGSGKSDPEIRFNFTCQRITHLFLSELMKIRPFQGLIPRPDLASEVASPPYDVVDRREARELSRGNPKSFLRVVRAEIDLPEETDPYSPAVYERARDNLNGLRETGALARETSPSLYVYEQGIGNHRQKGLVSVCHVDDYRSGRIKKHERTQPRKVEDRTRLNATLDAHPGPVFMMYRDDREIDTLVERIQQDVPLIEFTAPDGVRHSIWKIVRTRPLVNAFARIGVSYVADGHHRSASAARLSEERQAANPHHTGREDYNWFLAVNFPASQLKILPYNRLVHDLNGHSREQFLQKLKSLVPLAEQAGPSPERAGQVSMFLENRWYGLQFPDREFSDPARVLDVSRLQETILKPILGIEDPRTSDRIDFIGGVRGPTELEKRVSRGDGPVAFAMHPVSVEQIMDIADAGKIMPTKSTWFEPKLRSGLFIHTI